MVDRTRLAYASVVATMITAVYVVLITITAEYSPALKDSLKSFTGHHWTTKSLSSLALFMVLLVPLYFLDRSISQTRLTRSVWLLIKVVLLAAGALLAFFIWHYLGY